MDFLSFDQKNSKHNFARNHLLQHIHWLLPQLSGMSRENSRTKTLSLFAKETNLGQ